jgi:hypothetical protein
MSIRYRPMQPKDVAECVNLIAAHPDRRSTIRKRHRQLAVCMVDNLRLRSVSHQEVRRANSSTGLNCVIWQLCLRPEDTKRPDVSNHVMSTFLQEHRGFAIKELIALQAIFEEELQWIPAAGASSCRDPSTLSAS